MAKGKVKAKSQIGAVGSLKSAVIEAIFFDRWDPKARKLRDARVTLPQISTAIRTSDAKLSTRNPANFFKDFVRNKASANANWPKSILSKGYTAEQETGQGKCFRFVPLASGQSVAFPPFEYPRDPSKAFAYLVQSASLSPFARLLGRTDETWLIQVIVRLKIVETHFALFSTAGLHHVDHLQTGVRGAVTEIDALFLGESEVVGNRTPRRALITLEAKGARDDILENQILRQIESALAMRSMKGRIDVVIPLAAKTIGPSKIYFAEYKSVAASGAAPKALDIVTEGVYTVSPPVPGIE